MVPNEIECTECGQLAPVMSSVPIYDDPGRTLDADPVECLIEVSCKIDCPHCGNRIQVIRVADS